MTAADPDTALPLDPAIAAVRIVEPPRWRRSARGLRSFVRRSPLSAFWGCIAALIILVAVAAPELAPYPPLKSDFRALTKPPGERHLFGTDPLSRAHPPPPTPPRHLGRPRLLNRRDRRGVVRHDLGRALGSRERLFRRPLRPRQPAHHRVSAILSRFDPGDGDRDGIGGRLRHGHRRDRDHPDSVWRTRHPRRRAVPEGDVLRRGGARPRRLAYAHDAAPHPAAMHRPLSDPRDDAS